MAIIRRTTTPPVFDNAADRNTITNAITWLKGVRSGDVASREVITRFNNAMDAFGRHKHDCVDQFNDQGAQRTTRTGMPGEKLA